MIQQSVQQKYLERILNSKEFCGSKIYKTYLAYLVESTTEGKDLKETTIAIEVFGKDAHFNPAEDTIVRSHTYNLRKKLETYYYEEGKEDKYKLEIPKGHYEVTFVPQSNSDSSFSHGLLNFVRQKYYLVIILFLLAALVVLWYRNQTLRNDLQSYQIIDKNDPIWSNYLQSELPVLIVVGDHFFFDEWREEYNSIISIRHGKINSREDFENLKSKHPDNGIAPTPEPYFPYHSIWSLSPILPLLYSVHQRPILRKSSAVTPQMLDEYNMIFVGSIKTLYIMRHTLAKSHFRFEIAPHKIIYSSPDSSSDKLFETSLHSPGPNEDLVLALKLPGPKQNTIFIIASYHSLGAPEIATYLAAPSTRAYLENLFEEKYGAVPEYFEILFRVTGIDKTAYNTEILIYNKISTGNPVMPATSLH